MVIVFAVLSLGLVSGASWKTDAGSLTTAPPPALKAPVFPVPMAPIEPAPETLPSLSSSPPAGAGFASDSPRSLSSVRAAEDPRVICVVIEKNVTLRHLSLQYLDRFDSAALAAILLLNPAIADPNHIEAGRQIRLPLYIRRDAPGHTEADTGRRAVVGKHESTSEERP